MEQATSVPQPQAVGAFSALRQSAQPQDYYEHIKQKFAAEHDLRLKYRPEGTAQYTSDLTGALTHHSGEGKKSRPLRPRFP